MRGVPVVRIEVLDTTPTGRYFPFMLIPWWACAPRHVCLHRGHHAPTKMRGGNMSTDDAMHQMSAACPRADDQTAIDDRRECWILPYKPELYRYSKPCSRFVIRCPAGFVSHISKQRSV